MQSFETFQTFKCGIRIWKLKEFSCRPQQHLFWSCSNENDNFVFLYSHISSSNILCEIVSSIYEKHFFRLRNRFKVYLKNQICRLIWQFFRNLWIVWKIVVNFCVATDVGARIDILLWFFAHLVSGAHDFTNCENLLLNVFPV